MLAAESLAERPIVSRNERVFPTQHVPTLGQFRNLLALR